MSLKPLLSSGRARLRLVSALLLVVFAFVALASSFAANRSKGSNTTKSTRISRKPRVSVAAPANPACTLPGLTILTDATGDELDMVSAHDVQSLQIAEPFVGTAPDEIFFTLKVASLSTVPPDTYWATQFTVGGTVYTVRMSTVPPATPAAPVFEYYKGTVLTATGPPPLTPTTAADPTSSFSVDGTIKIVVPRSGVGNPAIGSN